MTMPVTIEWGNESKTISHIKFIRPWVWDEYYITYKTGYEMTESVDHIVNIIMDFSKNDGRLPASALTHFRKAAANAHPRRGVVVIVSPRMTLVKTLLSIVQKIGIIATPIMIANTVEEAYGILNHLIEERPDTLPLR